MQDDSLGLADLEALILASAARVAPEQEDQLRALIAEEHLQVQFDRDAHDIFVGVQLDTNVIVLGTRCLARLWAHTYVYCSMYKQCVQDSEAVEFHALPAGLLPGLNLLVWAINDQSAANQGRPRVPPSPSAPRPEHASGTNLVRIVNEVFFCACAYLLHHEIGHVRLGHARRSAGAHQDEFDADKAAADWILLTATEGQRNKRLLGISCALLWLFALQVHRLRSPFSATHPTGALRIQAVMFPRLPDAHDGIWAFLSVAMSYHLQAVRSELLARGVPPGEAGPEYHPGQFAVARDAVRQLIADGQAASRRTTPPPAGVWDIDAHGR